VRTELYWVQGTWPGRIAVMPRPRGGEWLEDEVRAWRDAGIDVVVSLLERDEVADLDLAKEEELSRANRIEFLSLPIVDRGVPDSREAVSELLTELAADLRAGKSVAVHCRQGIGRAALIAVSLLIRLGVDPTTAIELVSIARGHSVPETAEQRQWIAEFARLPLGPLPT
jgi:protein-tyrosine phosphatase